MKKDNRMILAVILLSVLSFFLFSQDAQEKISSGGILLLLALAAGYQAYLFIRKRPWPERRFGLLCGGMGMTAVLLIRSACGIKANMEEYGDLVMGEGWIVFAVVLIWCGLCVWTEKGVTENVVLLILFGAFLIRVFYAVLVQSHILQNDVGTLMAGDYGHLGYIHYLYSEGRLPDVNPMRHYQFYQPPLHHAVCALLVKGFAAVGYGMGDIQEMLQILAVMYGTLTLFFLNKIGIRLRIPPLGRGIGLAFASFLPYSIMMGGALNNDSPMTLLAVMALYYTLVWYESPGYKNIVIMALCIGCAMMVKVSGALAAPTMAALMLHKAWKEKERWKTWLKQFACFGVISLPMGLWYSVLRYIQYGMPFGYVPYLSEELAQFIGTRPLWSRFFDFENAFRSLSLSWNNEVWVDYNIPVSMIKCAVFGEGYGYGANPALYGAAAGVFWATLVLALLVAAGVLCWFFQKKHTVVEKMCLGVTLALSLGSYFKFCLDYPFVCTMNIRYIMIAVYLAFLIFGAAAGEMIEKAGRRSRTAAKSMGAAAAGLAGAYIAGAVTLIVQAGQVLP